MNTFWDQRYGQQDYVYGRAPNVFFREQLEQLEPGRILLPGEGEGRNAVYAALTGWTVDAIDSSQVGYQKAIKLADEEGVSIRYDVADLFDIALSEGAYDVVGLFFVHVPLQLRRVFHEKMMRALKPGGVVILEAFHVDQLYYNSGGPANEAMLFSEARLQEDFGSERIRHMRVCEKELDEGVFHQGRAMVIDMVAVKD